MATAFAASSEWNSVLRLIKFIRSKLSYASILRSPVSIGLRSDLFTWCHNVAFTGKEVGDETCEIQNRNMVLLSILFSYLMACAQNQKIGHANFEIHGGFKDGEMADCNTTFFNGLTNIFGSYHDEYDMKIVLLPNSSRRQTYSKVKKLLGGSQHQLELVLSMITSCYAPINGKACLSCWKCKKIAEGK